MLDACHIALQPHNHGGTLGFRLLVSRLPRPQLRIRVKYMKYRKCGENATIGRRQTRKKKT